MPLHTYFVQALNSMYAHLKTGAALPQSQVVRTVRRDGSPGSAPAITTANVPPIKSAPAADDQIIFGNNTLAVPE